jgi:hypothetical protein
LRPADDVDKTEEPAFPMADDDDVVDDVPMAEDGEEIGCRHSPLASNNVDMAIGTTSSLKGDETETDESELAEARLARRTNSTNSCPVVIGRTQDVSPVATKGLSPILLNLDMSRHSPAMSSLGGRSSLASKMSVRILHPPHPICSLQNLDALFRAQRNRKQSYGGKRSKIKSKKKPAGQKRRYNIKGSARQRLVF